MKCPRCGDKIKDHCHAEPVGRPRTISRVEVAKLQKVGMSVARVAAKLGVTRQAIYKILNEGKSLK